MLTTGHQPNSLGHKRNDYSSPYFLSLTKTRWQPSGFKRTHTSLTDAMIHTAGKKKKKEVMDFFFFFWKMSEHNWAHESQSVCFFVCFFSRRVYWRPTGNDTWGGNTARQGVVYGSIVLPTKAASKNKQVITFVLLYCQSDVINLRLWKRNKPANLFLTESYRYVCDISGSCLIRWNAAKVIWTQSVAV